MNRRSSNSTKVFVGSLPPGTTADELRELFSPYGEISECDVVNRCGFLHLEEKNLAIKAIDELNNSSFKGSRISVEKGRVKPPRNGNGPMRRDNFRDNFRMPYMRDGGGDFERRPRAPMGGNGYRGRGSYDRGFDNRQPPPSRPMNDSYGNGPPERRPYDDRNDRRGYQEDRRYDGGYMGPGGDNRMYHDDRNMYQEERRPMLNDRQGPIDQRTPFERRPMLDERKPFDDRNMLGDRRGTQLNDRSHMMDDRRGMIPDRRPLIDSQGGLGSSTVGPLHSQLPLMNQPYDRRPQSDIYSRREAPPKPMGSGYNDVPRNTDYDSYNAPMQNRGYPAARRDMPPVRRF